MVETQKSTSADTDTLLLKALAMHYRAPHQAHFDASTISGDALLNPALLAAMNFLKPHIPKSAMTVRLSDATTARLRGWFDQIDGRVIDAMRLERNHMGWCRIVDAI
jgi:hypothetical protein